MIETNPVLRAVLDANVYVSAVLQPAGPPGLIVERFLREKAFETVLSSTIVEEVLSALAYPKIRKLVGDTREVELWFEDIVLLADVVAPKQDRLGICEDPDDDKYLAAALEGRADYVVTGDRALLSVSEYEEIRVVTPRAFLDRLAAI